MLEYWKKHQAAQVSSSDSSASIRLFTGTDDGHHIPSLYSKFPYISKDQFPCMT